MMRANCFLLALAVALGLLGVAWGDAVFYPPPYLCVYYYMCANSAACSGANGTCADSDTAYNHTDTEGDGIGMCLYETEGGGCIYFNGNGLCYIINYYDDPVGTECNVFDFVCNAPSNTATGCEYGLVPP